MAARKPGRFTDHQRAEMWRLHLRGLPSDQIAAELGKGTGGVAPFHCTGRGVRSVLARMRAERTEHLVEDLDAMEAEKVVDESLAASIRGLQVRLNRFKSKAIRGKLSVAEYAEWKAAAATMVELKRLAVRAKSLSPRRSDAKVSAGNGSEPSGWDAVPD